MRRTPSRLGEAGAVSDLDHLLDLQANDTHADQLRHRRETLPERAQLVELGQRRAAVEASVIEPRTTRDDLAREQKRIEDEIATVEEKVAHVDQQLYGGGVTSPKEAQALQADLESLKRRQSQLEDQVLELMEQIEPLDAELADSEAALAAVAAETAEAEAALAAGEAEVDAELAAVAAARADLVAQVPAELVTEYEHLRPSMGGVAVAKLVGPDLPGLPPHPGLRRGRRDPAPPRRRHRPLPRLRAAAGPMILWFAGVSFVFVWWVFRSPALDYRLVMLGSILPVGEVVLGGPRLLHTLLGPVALLVLIMLATQKRRLVRRRWIGIPIGMLMHLVLDGIWARAEVFWWPFLGTDFGAGGLPELGHSVRGHRAVRAGRPGLPGVGLEGRSTSPTRPPATGSCAPATSTGWSSSRRAAEPRGRTVLIIVRHGRTAHNASGLLLGRLDPPLDELGRAQAAALAADGGAGRPGDLQPAAAHPRDGGGVRSRRRDRRALDRARLRRVRRHAPRRGAARDLGPLAGRRRLLPARWRDAPPARRAGVRRARRAGRARPRWGRAPPWSSPTSRR